MTLFGFDLAFPVLVLGVITGMTYGLLAVGLILVYRSNRIINFAHGEIGAFGAVMLGTAVLKWHVPYWVAFPFAIAISAGLGAVSEVVVVRRLRRAPVVMTIIATLGLGVFILAFALAINSSATATNLYPVPSGLPKLHIGALTVTASYVGTLLLAPVVVVGLALFFRLSRVGLAVRGSAANSDMARLSGISSSRMSSLAWALAGGLSAFTAILILPTQGFVSNTSLGPSLLLRALTAAVLARMTSLPIAFVAGVGVGVIEQELFWNNNQGGVVEGVLVAIILVALLLQRRQQARRDDKGAWLSVTPWAPLPDRLREVWAIRHLGRITFAAVALLAVGAGAVASNSSAIFLVGIAAFTLVGLSVGLIVGLAGQLSLGQFAIAGAGATASAVIARETGNFFLAFLGAGLTGSVVSMLVGVPALRIRGLLLAITTIGVALVAQNSLLRQSWALGNGVDPGRPVIAGHSLEGSRSYYFFALAVVGFGFWFAGNIWRSGLGRRLRALRDNEDGARAFTIPVTAVKLQAFALAGFLAGIGGAVYGHGLSRVTADTFPVEASISVVALTLIGGVGILAGPLIGALYIIGVPHFVPLDSAGLAASSLGWLVLILYFPGGVAQVIQPLRDGVVRGLARRAGVDPNDISVTNASMESAASVALTAASRSQTSRPAAAALLEVHSLSKHFGGIAAVADVSIAVAAGETLGLIGPNGAGKTTLFELISGFTRADSGRVIFAGQDVTAVGPEGRAQRGLIRSFQDAALFPTLTVLECVQVAFERTMPTKTAASLLGLGGAERRREAKARDLVHLMGLDDYRSKTVAQLSTGTRRITELACLVALEPVLLLLDEPSSGIAQRETEVLADVLRSIKAHLDTTLVIIEHDMPLIMGLSDRIVAMESGRVIATGTPEAIQADPLVIESYLGITEPDELVAVGLAKAVSARPPRARASRTK